MTDPNAQSPDPNVPPTPSSAAPLPHEQDVQWGSFAHLGGVLGFLPSLIIWLVFKDRGSFTNTEAKEALNFQITIALRLRPLLPPARRRHRRDPVVGVLDRERRVLGHRVPPGEGRQPLPLPVRDPPHQVGSRFDRATRTPPPARRLCQHEEQQLAFGRPHQGDIMSDATPPPPPPQNPYEQTPQLSPADEKLWATLIHVAGIFFYFVPALIGYLLLKDQGPVRPCAHGDRAELPDHDRDRTGRQLRPDRRLHRHPARGRDRGREDRLLASSPR